MLLARILVPVSGVVLIFSTCGVVLAAGFSDLNKVFGVEIWHDDNLWDDPDSEAAARLRWPEESRTPRDASYRSYAGADDRVLGVRPYSLALYGEGGTVSNLSLVFANKGDMEGLEEIAADTVRGSARATAEAIRAFHEQVEEDEKTIEARLTALLGESRLTSFGKSRQMRERVRRWDWQGHAILLAAPDGEYAGVRVLPVDVADGTRKPRVSDADLRDELATRVEKRPNGDVVLTGLPMVNQGPKGYCVPATWERALRYMGIPADMYLLAMAGNSGVGGGTSIAAIVDGAKETVTRSGRRIERSRSKLSLSTVRKYIDRGLPIMWTMHSMPAVNEALNQRMADRSAMTSPKAWNDFLKPIRQGARKIGISPEFGHVCMIIGYNEETDELAVSDSWGAEFAERWMTVDEANAVSMRDLLVIQF